MNWDISKEDFALLSEIGKRYGQSGFNISPPYDVQDLIMDLNAVHANGCPMDFAHLLEAPTSDFGHDVLGVRRHLNRRTGKLGDFFLPRCAKRQPTANSPQEHIL